MSKANQTAHRSGVVLLLASVALWATPAQSQTTVTVSNANVGSISGQAAWDRTSSDAIQDSADIPGRLRRQVVEYATAEVPGTVIVDTPNTYLYFVLGGGKAIRYGIGVGRDGFTWSGIKEIERKSEWPDWIPPSEMLLRQPYLPRFMAGGPGNPLGARAMYLGGTVYRIHGTNQPATIGKQVSSGCIRMLNADVIDLYGRTRIGTKVVVLPMQDIHIAHARLASVRGASTQAAAFPTVRIY